LQHNNEKPMQESRILFYKSNANENLGQVKSRNDLFNRKLCEFGADSGAVAKEIPNSARNTTNETTRPQTTNVNNRKANSKRARN